MSSASDRDEITSLLMAWRGGDDAALAALMPLVYSRLKGIARRILRGQYKRDNLQSTALVHEAYLRLADLRSMSWQDRAHFFAMSARLMRHILVDHARRRATAKRGGGEPQITIEDLGTAVDGEEPHLLALDEALRELAKHDPERAHIVELRFFGGLSRREIAEVLGVSSSTVTRRWRSARAWLGKYLSVESR